MQNVSRGMNPLTSERFSKPSGSLRSIASSIASQGPHVSFRIFKSSFIPVLFDAQFLVDSWNVLDASVHGNLLQRPFIIHFVNFFHLHQVAYHAHLIFQICLVTRNR